MLDKIFERFLKGELFGYLERIVLNKKISMIRPGKPGMTVSLFYGIRMAAKIATLQERYESRVREKADRETWNLTTLSSRHR